jgi:acetyl-CoA carboxylase biotin carboxyl carrier protein
MNYLALKKLLHLLDGTSIDDVLIQEKSYSLHIKLNPQSDARRHAIPHIQKQKITPPATLSSPMVGIVYFPDSLNIGQKVKAGDLLCLIESIKQQNPIMAHKSGSLKKIFVADKDPVEYGQALFEIN